MENREKETTTTTGIVIYSNVEKRKREMKSNVKELKKRGGVKPYW